jgi:hypothetical protein
MNVVIYACTNTAELPKAPAMPEAFALQSSKHYREVHLYHWREDPQGLFSPAWACEASFNSAHKAIEWIAKKCQQDNVIWVTL